ncbi:MAG: MFS transporter [Pseudomonadota bacterium]
MSRPPHLATLMICSAVTVLSLNMFLPSLAQIAREFGVSFATVTWAVSGYLGVTAALQLFIGPISDRVGRRPVVLCAFTAFTLLSVVCAMAESFALFLTARLLQGAVIAGATMALATVRDTADAERAASQISWVSMGMAVGPMIAPVIGGALDAAFGWRSVFWFLALGGATASVLAAVDWGETNRAKSASFGAQFRAYPALLAAPAFWAFSGVVIMGVGCFYIFISGAPLVADRVLDISSTELGLAIGIITMGFFLGNGVSGTVATRVGLGGMVVAGRALQVAAISVNLGLLWAGLFEPISFFGLMALVGFGNGIASPSANAGLMSVNPALAGSAAGLSGSLTLGLGAVFTALSARLMEAGPPAAMLLITMLVVACLGLGCAVAAYRLTAGSARASRT